MVERKEKLRRNDRADATPIELIKWPMEERNPVADDEARKAGKRPTLQLFRQLLRKDFGNSRNP